VGLSFTNWTHFELIENHCSCRVNYQRGSWRIWRH